MSNEIQKVDPDSPAGIMIQLMSGDGPFDVEGFGKMLEFQERHEANVAKKVYASDFALAQADIAAVTKTKSNPQTHSKYAGLEGVLEMSRPVYTKYGFSVIYYEGKSEIPDDMRLCADVLHKAGHKETYHFDVPLDGVGIKGNPNMTKIHGKASSVSYGRRYLLCMIWNIPTQDDDGNAAGDKKPEIPEITATNKKVLSAICKILTESVDGRTIDTDKVAGIFFAQKGSYPSDMKMTGAAAAWLISLGRQESWLKPMSESDRVFAAYCKHFKEADISREKFNACIEGCKIELVDTQTGEQWIIENIPVKNTLA